MALEDGSLLVHPDRYDSLLRSGMSKAELDSYLEWCGAIATNPFSVEEIFRAVSSAVGRSRCAEAGICR